MRGFIQETPLLALLLPVVSAGAACAQEAGRGGGGQAEVESARAAEAPVAACTVARIVDGDTFVCEGGERIRLLLIDADERGQSVYADSASALARRLMPPGSPVRLELDIDPRDRYGRTLAYVYADSVFVNRELIRRGFAHVVVYPPNVAEVEVMRAAADSARAEGLGIWAGSAFECRPADYRAGRCGGG